MGSLVVVEPEVVAQFPAGLCGVGVGFQVHLLILHGAPQPLHEDVVGVPALPVHADLHPVFLQHLSELQAGELTPLVGVEDLRLALPQRLLQGVDAEVGLQGVGQSPGHHVPAVPVHDGHQVEESPGHGQVGDVGGPRLVGPGNSDLFQQIGIDPVLRRRPAGAGTPVDGPQPHDAHQSLHPLPAHPPALPGQPDLHAPRPVEGCIQVLSVHGLHHKARFSPEASLGR